MLDCENVIMQELSDKRIKRKGIALTYAFAIESDEEINFKRINEAIMKRWSKAGLIWIKTLAWKYIEGKEQP